MGCRLAGATRSRFQSPGCTVCQSTGYGFAVGTCKDVGNIMAPNVLSERYHCNRSRWAFVGPEVGYFTRTLGFWPVLKECITCDHTLHQKVSSVIHTQRTQFDLQSCITGYMAKKVLQAGVSPQYFGFLLSSFCQQRCSLLPYDIA
jgi:hypothetical protein